MNMKEEQLLARELKAAFEAVSPFIQWHTAKACPSCERLCCIDRHGAGVNGVFMDGSVRRIGLKELWTLRWHRYFPPNGPWTKAGGVSPSRWPRWMRGLQDY